MELVQEKFRAIASLAAIESRPTKRCMSGQASAIALKLNRNPGWFGFDHPATRREAFELLKSGWVPEDWTPARIKNALDAGEKKAVTYFNDVRGFFPDVSAALQGRPESMINAAIQKKPAKIIKISLDPCTNSGISGTEKLDAGLNLISVIAGLEKKGYRVQLDVSCWTFDYNNSLVYNMAVRVKDPGMSLNLKKFAYCVAHPSFQRVINFAWKDKVAKKKIANYGRSFAGMEQQKDLLDFRASHADGVVLDYSTTSKGVGPIMEALKIR